MVQRMMFSMTFLYLVFFPGFAGIASAKAKVVLTPGQTHRIAFPQSKGSLDALDIHVSNGKVIHVSDTGTELVVKALRPGNSRVSSGHHHWWIEVIGHHQFQEKLRIKQTMKALMGLKADRTSTPLLIKGFLYRWRDLDFIARQLRGLKYQLDIQVSPSIRNDVREYLKKRSYGLRLPKVRFQPRLYVEYSHIKEDSQRKKLENHYSEYGIPLKFLEQGLDVKPLIEVEVLIAEVHRSLQRQWGIDWEGGYQLLPRLPGGRGLEIALKAMESQGQGQILASPRLLCRSGSKAEFLAGGEFPIKVIHRRRQDVVWKRHGVHLSILPTADHQGC